MFVSNFHVTMEKTSSTYIQQMSRTPHLEIVDSAIAKYIFIQNTLLVYTHIPHCTRASWYPY